MIYVNNVLHLGGITVGKMDEMEMLIALKSIRAAWAYSVIFLFIWMIYTFVQTSQLGLPFVLLISQNLVLFASQLFLNRQAAAGNNEE